MANLKEQIVYVSTRNNKGIMQRVLLIDDEGYIYGESNRDINLLNTYFCPLGHTSTMGSGQDWRIGHAFFTHEEALRDYIDLQLSRMAAAREALGSVLVIGT